jgi:hypothetical protein
MFLSINRPLFLLSNVRLGWKTRLSLLQNALSYSKSDDKKFYGIAKLMGGIHMQIYNDWQTVINGKP